MPKIVRILLWVLLVPLIFSTIFVPTFDDPSEKMAKNLPNSESLTDAQVAKIYENAALSGTPIKLDAETEKDLQTGKVTLDRFMSNPYTLTPFGDIEDVTLTLEALESIHRPCTEAEKYQIYRRYDTYASSGQSRVVMASRKPVVEEKPETEAAIKPSLPPLPLPIITAMPTPKPTPTSNPTPTLKPTPTPKPTSKPTSTPSPSPTPTPIPTVSFYCYGHWMTMYVEDKDRADRVISQGVDEERTVQYDYQIPGATVSEYLNTTYHIPWQALYNCTAFASWLDNGEASTTDKGMDITEEEFTEVCNFFSEFEVSYIVDYWDENCAATSAVLNMSNAADLLSNCYMLYYDDSKDIKPFDSSEKDVTIKWRKGIKPFVSFKRIEEWALTRSYLTYDYAGHAMNYYALDASELSLQSIGKSVVSDALQTFISNYEFSFGTDLSLFTYYGLEDLPGSDYALADFLNAYDMISGKMSGFAFDTAMLSWIDGDATGEQVVKKAESYIGFLYDNARRFEDGYADCSSLTYRVFKELGYDISYAPAMDLATTAAGECEGMVARGMMISDHYDPDILQPGDLLYWMTTNKNHASYSRYLHVYHTGIFCGFNEEGEGVIIDASSTIGRVVCRTMWGTEKIVGIARVATD